MSRRLLPGPIYVFRFDFLFLEYIPNESKILMLRVAVSKINKNKP